MMLFGGKWYNFKQIDWKWATNACKVARDFNVTKSKATSML